SALALPRADDSDSIVAEAEPQFLFDREPLSPNTVTGPDLAAQPFYRVRGVETRHAAHAISFLLRPFDQDTAERFSGDHGVLGRAPVGPVGEQLPWDLPQRAVFRPVPQAWDSGYVRFQ